jgi:hypothetical protein
MAISSRESLLPVSESYNARRRVTPSTPPSPIKPPTTELLSRRLFESPSPTTPNGVTKLSTISKFPSVTASTSLLVAATTLVIQQERNSSPTPPNLSSSLETTRSSSKATLIAIVFSLSILLYIVYSQTTTVGIGYNSSNKLFYSGNSSHENKISSYDAHVRRLEEIQIIHEEHSRKIKQQNTKFERRSNRNQIIVDDNLPADEKWSQGMFNEFSESTRTCPDDTIQPYYVDSLQRYYKQWRTPSVGNYEIEQDNLELAKSRVAVRWGSVYPDMTPKCKQEVLFSNVQDSNNYHILCPNGEYAVYTETDRNITRSLFRPNPPSGKIVYNYDTDEIFMSLCAEKNNAKNLFVRVAYNQTLHKQQNEIYESHAKQPIHGHIQPIPVEDRVSILMLKFKSLSRPNFMRSMRYTKGIIEKLEYDTKSSYRVTQFWKYQTTEHSVKFEDLEPMARKLGYVTFEASNYCNRNGIAHHQLNRIACMKKWSGERNCLHGKNVEDYMFEYVEDMLQKYRNDPKFGVLNFDFLNSLHPTDIDYMVGKFLDRITTKYKNLAILVMSDKGEDVGPLYVTPLGQLEFKQALFIPIVSTKLQNYEYAPRIVENFAYNQDKLFVACDLFVTVAHFLQFPNKDMPEYIKSDFKRLLNRGFNRYGQCRHLQAQLPEQTCSQYYHTDVVPQLDCVCPTKTTKSSFTESDEIALADIAIDKINEHLETKKTTYPGIQLVKDLRKVLLVNHVIQPALRSGITVRPSSEFVKVIFSVTMTNNEWQVFQAIGTRSSSRDYWIISQENLRRISVENGQACTEDSSFYTCKKL